MMCNLFSSFTRMSVLKLSTIFTLGLSLVGTLVFTVPASAQSIEEASNLYKAGDYHDASIAFYDVLQHDSNPDIRDKAEIYLAESLYKLGLYVPAMFYYTDIFREAGKDNRYYINALEGLLRVQSQLHDPLIVPSLINAQLDPEAFAPLDSGKVSQVNYLIGELSYRQGKNSDAKVFLEYVLEYVPSTTPLHAKALYLLGLLQVRAGNGLDALARFRSVITNIPNADDASEEQSAVRNLAILAAGRVLYGEGRYAEALKYYKQVPRFSSQWFFAMYEQAWAHFNNAATVAEPLREYGKALGHLQSVTSPYFSKRHVPEAYVIASVTYFVNCQWDRVRREVSRYKTSYEPMLNVLQGYLKNRQDGSTYYLDVVKGGAGRFSLELARDVRRLKRFKDYHYMITHMDWEVDAVKGAAQWKGSRLAEDILSIIEQQKEQLLPAVGNWVKSLLEHKMAALQNFQNQINILDFEVADAERRWLEQGKETRKGRRARLPRPEIPNEQWQHWDFEVEYWKDELGYIQYSIASECPDTEG